MLDRLFNLVRPAETKAFRTARLIALDSPGRARWTPRDYAALAREGYLVNAVVYRAVRLVAANAASCAFLAYEGAAERESHPLIDLIARPNPRQDGAALFEALYSHLLLAGNAYVEAAAVDGAVRELYALRPDRMKLVPGADGWAEAYEYTVAGRTVRFDQAATPVPPILHLAAFHPLDDHYGMSALEAAAVAVDVHNASARWCKALLDNSARPSGAGVRRAGGLGALRRPVRAIEARARGAIHRHAQRRPAAAPGRRARLEGGDGDLRYKMSKESAAKTLSLLMQTNFSGRAEVGLTGDDDLHVKVSPDGTTWFEGLTLARASGQVRLGIDGTASAPALSFASDTDNGAYRIGTNNWGLAAGGSKILDIGTAGLGITGTLTVSGLITATAGQIAFPATQNASANANTLDDYEEGTWTPVVTFATPGNLSVAYTTQVGVYTKIGRVVLATNVIVTSAFTHTTASGICR